MAKIKVSFPTYPTLEAPAKSLVNFLTQHGSFCFTPHNWPELVEATITNMSKSGNDCVFTLDDVETNDIIYAYGILKDSNETKTFDATDTIVRLGSDHKVTITTDDPSYTNYEDLMFYVVPTDMNKMFGCLQPNDPCVSSGYSIGVPLCPSVETHETYPVCASAIDYKLGVMVFATTPGAAGNDLRVKFERGTYDDVGTGYKVSVYDGDTLQSYVIISYYDASADVIDDAFRELDSPKLVNFLSYNYYDLPFYECGIEDDGDSLEMQLSGGSDDNAEGYLEWRTGFNNSTYPYIGSVIKQSTTSLTILKEVMTMGVYPGEIDDPEPHTMACMINDDSFINIPVTCKLLSSATNDADLVPYSIMCRGILDSDFTNYYGKIKLDINEEDKENHPIDYQLRTSSFYASQYYTPEEEIYDEDYVPPEPISLYYKIGICAKDGTAESTATLANEFKNSTMMKSAYLYGYSEFSYNLLRVIAKIYNNEEEAEELTYFYSTTAAPGAEPLIRVACSEDSSKGCINLPCSTIMPLIKTNFDGSGEFKGVMYMQLCISNNEDGEIEDCGKEVTESIIGTNTRITASRDGSMEADVHLSIENHDINNGNYIHSECTLVAM